MGGRRSNRLLCKQNHPEQQILVLPVQRAIWKAATTLCRTRQGACQGSGRTQVGPWRRLQPALAGKSLSVALPTDAQINPSDAIESLGMGFFPTVEMSGKTGGAFLIPNEPEFRLDFLTPLHRHGDMPYRHPGLQIDLQPLPFMEFSLEGVEQTALICPEGAVLVNVPDPARYAPSISCWSMVNAVEPLPSRATRIFGRLTHCCASLVSIEWHLSRWRPSI